MTPRLFGEKIAASVDWADIRSGAGRGALTGAALGGLYGLIDPGHEDEYDDEGRVIGRQQRNRFGALLRGALGGALRGGAIGGSVSYLRPGLVNSIYDAVRDNVYKPARRALTNKTQEQLNYADNVARMNPEQRQLHDAAFEARKKNWSDTRLPISAHLPELRPQSAPLASAAMPAQLKNTREPQPVTRAPIFDDNDNKIDVPALATNPAPSPADNPPDLELIDGVRNVNQ